ncbi:cellulase family glycosylhydrolase [Catenuloplanes atrovinosus]|uniref:Endoglucanase n=1 Tax=Catenuloplanes atrovinosus TaxID=137266 RepID=A0AAE4C8V5_9ACTN|nr:cellulase family glycosylhydrolase [Catenuloplanes atrovinosus]MDR7275398.1 mannan endo-1,4-beta-mannosidase [Catenuloplanes atrovinosus]
MTRKLLAIGAVLAAAIASVLLIVPPASAAVGLHVSGTDIVEANGQKLIMRGINHPHVWYTGQTRAFADIKATGANTVRVVLGTGKRWGPSNDVADVIALCKQNRLICVLEVHDTTGYGEEAAAASLDEAVNYWIGQQAALAGQESYVVINIGNEPIGNVDAGQWTAATAAAVAKMRANGFEHLLMVDAPNWGQDWQYTMRDTAQTVLDADPHGNTVLSIHMYAVFNTAQSIINYLDAIAAKGWPLVIGEFGWQFAAGEVDDATILAEAQRRGLGYIGWSWSGNTDPILDMVLAFDPAQITTWGERIINGPNGIRATSREASVYGGTQPTTPSTPSTSPSTSPSPGGRGCTAVYATAGQWQGGFQGDVTVTAGAAPITGWTVTLSFPNGQSVTQAWNATVTGTGATVTARNVSYNGALAARGTASFGLLGSWTGTNGAPAVACTAS